MNCLKEFNAFLEITHICDWIKNYFIKNGPEAKAVLGMSGGKDSTITARLLVRALGPERVIGVMIPNGEQEDKDMAILACDAAGIPEENRIEVNISGAINELYQAVDTNISELPIVYSNTPARMRMIVLYMIAGKYHGRVVNTCNYSEDYVGYSTKYGDAAGDFSILSNYCVREVIAIGKALGLHEKLIYKTPSDGMCGKTDEENLGFSYAVLDRYIRTGEIDDENVKKRIDELHSRNLFKLQLMPSFKYESK
jgi:NAD+ synthase